MTSFYPTHYALGQWQTECFPYALISSHFKFVNRVHAQVTPVICSVLISCLHSEYVLHDLCIRCICVLNHSRCDAIFVLTLILIMEVSHH